jgi:hypothetical protein
MTRSLRTDVRNPLLSLPAAARIANLPPECREVLAALLSDISQDARQRAEKCWRTHKAPMAAYWKAVAVYAGHAKKLTRSHQGEERKAA